MMIRMPCVAVIGLAGPVLGGPVEPFNYLQLADSPWLDQPGFAVEDLEDLLFDLPGVTPSIGTPIGPGGLTDSVDGDDGEVDGSGSNGRSLFAGDGSLGITFTIDPDAFEEVPTRVGVVWTDGGGTTTFEAFDLDGNSLGVTSVQIADGSNSGTTPEDHFFGFEHGAGIGAVKISNSAGGIEVDHIQYAGGEVIDCEADCNGDGNLNILDFVCFQGAWQAQTPLGDCDGNGAYNILDFVCYQGLFQEGCP